MTFDSWVSVLLNLTVLAATAPFMLRFFSNAREKVFSTDALDGIRRQTALAEQDAMQEQLLHLQKRQYEQLLKHMEEVKAAQHDLRQHLSVMGAYLETGDLEGPKGYLEAYGRNLRGGAWMREGCFLRR